MLAHDVAGASAPRRARPVVRRAGLTVLKAEVTVSEIHEEADAIFAVIDIKYAAPTRTPAGEFSIPAL